MTETALLGRTAWSGLCSGSAPARHVGGGTVRYLARLANAKPWLDRGTCVIRKQPDLGVHKPGIGERMRKGMSSAEASRARA
jgi:hypothetical protein